ncbi:MAG: ABC transporter ATP-binding protein [Acidimicrobiales bacterium]|jgi:iron(III) transport system ATP-binding protein|nr:ABC transporter ATP-binding protein [Acidimicrobiales bacterium]
MPSSSSSPAATVTVDGIVKSFGGTPVLRGVSVRVEPGHMLALLGPSGCGKTTLLRIIAGLELPDAGRVDVAGATLTDGPRAVPPERRRVGMVFQDWALFPHLSVARNVAYGLARDERRSTRVADALAMVGLEGLGDRLPATLSGGQQQRVALARAIAPQPSVLLLDEPFSNLDAALRVQVRAELHELLVELGITTLFVTHDQEEAFVLGDEVALMHAGEIVQQGPPAHIYQRPATRWVAGFVGEANFLPGRVGTDRAATVLGEVPLLAGADHGSVDVLVRPEELDLFGIDEAGGSGGAGATADVELIEYYGHDTIYVVRLRDGGHVRVRESSAPLYRRGDAVVVRYTGPPTVAFPAGP